MKISFRTGQVFYLNEDRVKQFSTCRFQGFLNQDLTPKNSFSYVTFNEAFLWYIKRNGDRKKAPVSRKKKSQEKAALAEMNENGRVKCEK